eukprot:403376572
MKKQQYLKEQLEQQMQESQARAKQREAERYDPNERQRALNVAQQFEQEKRQRSLDNKIKISHDLKETMEVKQFRIDMEQKMRDLEKQLISKSYQDLAQRDRMQQELKRLERDKQIMILNIDNQKQVEIKKELKSSYKNQDKQILEVENKLLRDRELQSKQFYVEKRSYYQSLVEDRSKRGVVDKNELKKQEALENMRKSYELKLQEQDLEQNRKNEQLRQSFQQAQQSNSELIKSKEQQQKLRDENEKNFGTKINQDAQNFFESEAQRKMRQKQAREQYALDLLNQMDYEKVKKLKENEMNPKEKQLNQNVLQAYQEGTVSTNYKVMPGFEKSTKDFVHQNHYRKGPRYVEEKYTQSVLNSIGSPKSKVNDRAFSNLGQSIISSQITQRDTNFDSYSTVSQSIDQNRPKKQSNFHYSQRDNLTGNKSNSIQSTNQSDIYKNTPNGVYSTMDQQLNQYKEDLKKYMNQQTAIPNLQMSLESPKQIQKDKVVQSQLSQQSFQNENLNGQSLIRPSIQKEQKYVMDSHSMLQIQRDLDKRIQGQMKSSIFSNRGVGEGRNNSSLRNTAEMVGIMNLDLNQRQSNYSTLNGPQSVKANNFGPRGSNIFL